MKTTNLKIIIAVIAIAVITVSCGSKGSSIDAALAKIEKAMDKVEKNKTSMTEADWKALEAELEQPAKVLSDALESNQVSTLKKLKISAAIMRYTVVLSEAAMRTAVEQLEETHFADSIAAVTEQLHDVLAGDEMKQALQELQKATEELHKIVK